MQRLKKVLFIAYNFPPHGGAGVQRTVKFVKYLPEFGWQPVVVTTAPDACLVQDSSISSEVAESIPVYRVPGFSINRLHLRLQKHGLGRAAPLLNLALQIPDAARFWAANTRAVVRQIVECEKPELIYTTSGPYSSHLVGRWAKHEFKLPWFADFRDPWSKNLLIPYFPGYRTLNRYMERQVLESADRVACVSRPWLRDLETNLGKNTEKFLFLSNGYDEDDVEPSPLEKGRQFTLTHMGSFYRNRRPSLFLEAVTKLVDSGRIPKSEIRVMFIGRNAHLFVPDVPPFEVVPYTPHKELSRFRKETSVLVLILAHSPENAGNYSGKLFEYLASNRPILALAPAGGVAAELIKETRTGITARGDVDSVCQAVEKLYRQWSEGAFEWEPNWDVIRQYTRRNLTKTLADEFCSLIDSGAEIQ